MPSINPIYDIYEYFLRRQIKNGKIPEHIAIIMDGNRRLAKRFGIMPWEGHRLGADKLEQVLNWCLELGVKSVTAYAFSTENFNRPKEEVDKLLDLFEEEFNRIANDPKIMKNRVRVRAIGDIERFPERVKKSIRNAEESTKGHDRITLNVAVAYGGRQEITDAVKKIVSQVQDGKLAVDGITEKTISDFLYTKGGKDPELVIRTSGEERISGFLLWQTAYSELYFCESYWPGFRKIDFFRAIRTFQQRKRRFGK